MNVSIEIIRLRLSQVILWVGPLATLAINPWGNYDPISVVKLSIISSFAFTALALLISLRRLPTENRLLTIFSISFLISLIVPVFLSGAPLNQQIWGMFGRNTGFLAYVALLILLFATAVVKDQLFYSRLVSWLIYTSLPVGAYCYVQISGNDPIGWSSFETFGTLGNVNFLSAFLGMASISATGMALKQDLKANHRYPLLLLVASNLYIVQSTGSIQGLFVYGIGVVCLVFLRLRTYSKSFLWQSIFSVFILISSFPILAGLTGRGPLSKFLFQNSNVLRTDYWHAGWEMTIQNPIFGVGLDSYGDWYRKTRGQISTLRGSADRTSNSAHNIFLDLSSNGGVLLLFSYLALLFLALWYSYLIYKKMEKRYDYVFAAIFSVWLAYQAQALISINQLGVGIWGWIFTGALIGYGQLQCNGDKRIFNPIDYRKLKRNLLPASTSILTITGFLLGFVLSWFPLNADSKFFSAYKSRDSQALIEVTKLPGATAWHMSRVIELSFKSGAYDQAQTMTKELLRKYPRDFFGWRALWFLPTTSESEKLTALERMKQLDPFNPEVHVP